MSDSSFARSPLGIGSVLHERTWLVAVAATAVVAGSSLGVSWASEPEPTSTGDQQAFSTSTGLSTAESCTALVDFATVTTDQDDYAPGSAVVVSGSGFGGECDYELQVVRPDDVVEKFPVASDADGNLSHEYVLPPPPGVIGEYRIDIVDASGQVVASAGFMDNIAYESHASANTVSGGAQTFPIPRPTATAPGDFLIAQVSAGGVSSETICAPSGWTAIQRTTNGSDVAIQTFYKFATSADAAAPSFTFFVRSSSCATGSNQSRRMSGGILRYTGVDPTTPVEAQSTRTGASSTTLTANAVAATAGARVVAFYGIKKNTNMVPVAADSMAERFDVFVSNGSGPGSMAADLEQTTAGSTGDKRATAATGEVWAAQLVSLKAAASGPTRLAYTTSPRSGTVGQCLGPITVQTQNASDAPTNVMSATQVGLATNGTGVFASNGDCSTSISSAGIPSGSNSATFYYKPTARGTGSHALTASATGLTSASQTQTANKLDQAITFAAPSGKTYGDADFNPGATANSGLPVSYSSSTAGVCAITADNKVKIVGVGTCTVTASQAGNGDYNAAGNVERSFSVAAKQLSGSFAAADKVYDGEDDAAIKSDPAPALSGVVAGDEVSLDGADAAARFDTKDVGTGKTVTATGFKLAGAARANYTLVMQTTQAAITKAELAVNAEDETMAFGATPTPTYTLSGFKSNDDKGSAGVRGDADCKVDEGAGPNVGVYEDAITCLPGTLEAQNYSFTAGSKGDLTITKAPTTLVYTGDSSEQYSDVQTLSAELKSGSTGVSGKTITFKIGSQPEKQTTTDGNGVASTTLKIDQVPATTVVVATFAGDGNYSGSGDTKPFSVTKEDARAEYTGGTFASTGGPNSSRATVNLSATIRDITAVNPASDAEPGDIRKATVQFVNLGGAVLCSAQVGLVNAADLKTGTATCSWNVDIGSQDSVQYTVGIVVNGYYVDTTQVNASTVVTVSKVIAGMITGGGYLVNSASAGQVAGANGQKTNFGFNVRPNKSGTSYQGNINTIVRNGGRVYQIKGNSMTSLVTKVGTPGTATFEGKSSIQDITNPLAPVSVDGNATLRVTMTDYGEPGSKDAIGITVWNKAGGLWFSSNWGGTRTIEQLLGGGNLVVR